MKGSESGFVKHLLILPSSSDAARPCQQVFASNLNVLNPGSEVQAAAALGQGYGCSLEGSLVPLNFDKIRRSPSDRGAGPHSLGGAV